MTSKATSPEQYIKEVPADRKEAMSKLRNTVLKNLPKGFSERMSYGMIGYVVPHEIYPAGYHCNPALPLPFACIASQKNFIAFYHMGIYGDPKLLKWFTKNMPNKAPPNWTWEKAVFGLKNQNIFLINSSVT